MYHTVHTPDTSLTVVRERNSSQLHSVSQKMFWIEIDNSDRRDNRVGFGERPALVLIDFVRAYTNPASFLFASSILRAAGEAGKLLSVARKARIPVLHSHTRYFALDLADAGMWLKKKPLMNAMKAGNPLAEFCKVVAPNAGETIVAKQFPSAFFGTDLNTTLRMQRIDTIVLAGAPTSDGIRATAVDAIRHGYRVIVVRECVGDRCFDAHRFNLSDIDRNYGDVISIEDAVRAFELRD